MNRTLRLAACLIALSLLLSACATPLATPSDRKTRLPDSLLTPTIDIPTPAPTLPTNVIALAAQNTLAANLGIADPFSILVISLLPATWTDACLETGAQPTCDPANIPGFRALLSANGQLYQVHTNADGSLALQANTPPGQSIGLLAQQRLAEALNRPIGDLRLMGIAPVTWPDACLGMPEAAAPCPQQPTPGYRVIMEVDTIRYELHTNGDGSQIGAAPPQPGIGLPQLVWQGGEPCQVMEVSVLGLSLGNCDGLMTTYTFQGADVPAQLFEWITAFTPFIAQTSAGSAQLQGNGQQTASPSQQRAIAEWAAWLAHNAPGNGDPAFGLALEWQRSGGIAGSCETLRVMRSGLLFSSTCQGQAIGSGMLEDADLVQLYAWLDNLAPLESSFGDPTIADGFQEQLRLPGQGNQPADAATQTALLEFCARLSDQLRPNSQ